VGGKFQPGQVPTSWDESDAFRVITPTVVIMSDQARWKATVYVGGLSHMVNTESLHAAFLPFGEIADVSLP
jgi:hypothetical protein